MSTSTYEINDPGMQFSNLVTEYLWETEGSFEIGHDPVRINWVREFSEHDELGRGEVTVTVNYTSDDEWVHNHLFVGTLTEFFEMLTRL